MIGPSLLSRLIGIGFMMMNDIEVKPACFEDKSILRNLLQLYLYDFSEYDPIHNDVDNHGLFGYPYFDHYWTEPTRHPFLFRVKDKWAGFALVRAVAKDNSSTYHSLAEFCILRKYRGQGYGRLAAYKIFDRFPGKWHIAQIQNNLPAQAFWRTVIGEYSQGEYQEHKGEEGPYQLFGKQNKRD
jgi:predicted acetyltransferase